MRRGFRNPLLGFVLLILLGACTLALRVSARAGPPKITLIERFLTNQVLIHFDTEPNVTYKLEFTETLTTNGVPGGTWTNLYIAPNIPFPNHYVIPDTRTPRQRFYRLQVTQ